MRGEDGGRQGRADRTTDLDDNSATFLMTNMIPQAGNNNQRTWSGLEEWTRAQVKQGQEVYVLMGSYGKGGTGQNGVQNGGQDGGQDGGQVPDGGQPTGAPQGPGTTPNLGGRRPAGQQEPSTAGGN